MSSQYLLLLPFVLSSVAAAAQTQEAEPANAPAETQPQANEAKQCTVKIWVGREAEFEELLRTAEVISMEDIGFGVTKPLAVMLKKGIAIRAVHRRHIQHLGVAKCLLHSIANPVRIVFGLNYRYWNIGLIVENIICTLA